MSVESKSTISNDTKTGMRQNQSPELIRVQELRDDQSGAKNTGTYSSCTFLVEYGGPCRLGAYF